MSYVLTEDRAGVRLLTLNRPARRNAMHAAAWRAFAAALDAAREDPTVRVAVITGAGAAFCAGQDLSEFSGGLPAGDAPHPFSVFMDALCAFDKVLFAAVNGVGVGGGLTILLHCDFVLMSERARLKAPFVELGLIPEAASSYLLPLICGARGAAEVLFEAGWITAERALALNIANAVLPHEELLEAAMARAAGIARQAPTSLRYTKRLLMANRAAAVAAARAREDAGFAELVGGPENIEAVTAFFTKRAPDFSTF